MTSEANMCDKSDEIQQLLSKLGRDLAYFESQVVATKEKIATTEEVVEMLKLEAVATNVEAS